MALDITDDAVLLNTLRVAYYTILAGGKPQTVDVPSAGGGSRRITYAPSNLALLWQEIVRLQTKIEGAAGTSKRHVILAG